MLKLIDLFKQHISQEKLFQGKLLSLDPGETTGYAIFDCQGYDIKLHESGQLKCKPLDDGIDAITLVINTHKPKVIVYEDYKVYGWKATQHSWAELHTPQLIGCIRMMSKIHSIPNYHQMAQHAKGFMTDDKLQQWGFYIKGQKHTRDAIRHGLFYLLFNHIKTII